MLRAITLATLTTLLLAGCTTHEPVERPPASVPVPAPAPATYSAEGLASFYGKQHHGKRTANGETFDQHAMTAAHRTLPFGTWVRVTHLASGRSVEVRINDRGPYGRGRIIDLSHKAAAELGIVRQGVSRVRIEQLDR
ncbi:septal ring lytic transglycosylase RlpA family lipoprotein [Stutzerimonas nosocomialis]|uniref:septal ring lytic transglycosylase RlpA family protein n=1 Tax=Stutzerimonas nosocomialis TaxID=1056496 RepID=UPI001109A31E|nr:septal ring lytic transglycosylase RlpA family protein [Stutzerimonas nosocomialis]TLX60364.1 septal ring lytic transglycosylase RlpA family lipoprotein [Stutzerimonas nosocomialis]